MKRASLALAAWMLSAQLAHADESSGPIPLPANSRLSAAAQNAAEAPHWTPPPASANSSAPTNPGSASAPAAAAQPQAPPASVGSPIAAPAGKSVGVAGPATTQSPPPIFPAADDAKPINPNAIDTTGAPASGDAPDQPRPIQSVMIRRHDLPANAPSALAPSVAASAAPPATAPNQPTPSPFTSGWTSAPAVAPAAYDADAQTASLPAPPTSGAANATFSGTVEDPAAATRVTPASSQSESQPNQPDKTLVPIDPEKAAAARAADELLGNSLNPNPDDADSIRGNPVSLASVLAAVGEDPQRRLAALRAYWQLCNAVSDYHSNSKVLRRLEELQPRGPLESSMLSTARAYKPPEFIPPNSMWPVRKKHW